MAEIRYVSYHIVLMLFYFSMLLSFVLLVISIIFLNVAIESAPIVNTLTGLLLNILIREADSVLTFKKYFEYPYTSCSWFLQN